MLIHIQHLLFAWTKLYSLFLLIYLLGGVGITYGNQVLGPDKKIQSRPNSRQSIRREIGQSIKSLMSITLMLTGGLYCQSQGVALTPIKPSLWNCLALFLISMLIFDAWFYWGHRLIHTQPVYKWIHQWHHKSVTPMVWSNNNDTFLDNLVLQSYFFFAPFFLPIPSHVLIAHKLYDQVTGMLGHSGYEYSAGPLSRFPSPLIGVTFHDLHHETPKYNYGAHFSIWDRLMGTIHPHYEETLKKFEASPTSGP